MRQKLTALLRAAACALFILGLTATARAQFRAAVQGTVTDPAGAVVTDATVTLTNKGTGKTQTTTTSNEGFYRFSELPPGTYTVSVEKTGFKKSTLDNVVVNAEQVQGLDVVLTTGEVSETLKSKMRRSCQAPARSPSGPVASASSSSHTSIRSPRGTTGHSFERSRSSNRSEVS